MQFRTQAFPFCPAESLEVGAGTLYPSGISAQRAATWYWRVKLWTVEIGVSWGTYIFPDQQFLGPNPPPDTERDLICNDMAAWDIRDDDTSVGPDTIVAFDMFLFASSGAPQSGGGINVAASPGATFEAEPARKITSAIYPMLLFRLGAFRSGVTGTEEDCSTFNGSGNSPSATVFIVQDITIPVFANSASNISYVSVQPQEWWPYAPGSNPALPVWDAASGVQLRNPTVSD